MDMSDKDELGRACQRIADALGVTLDTEHLEKYLRGDDKTLISYEKVEQSSDKIPAIQKYFFGAEAYRRQPALDQYYDIFRAARMVPLVLILDHAITVLKAKVPSAAGRLARLAREATMDSFDAVLFEVVTAARYAECPTVREVVFLEETPLQPQPDLRAVTDGTIHYIECKKFDRTLDASMDIRDTATQKADVVLQALEHLGISAVVAMTFKVDPKEVPDEEVARVAGTAVRTGRPAETDNLLVDHQLLVPRQLSSYALYPSPYYFADRFGFLTSGEWQGIRPAMRAQFKGPSFLDAVAWESAVKWKVVDTKSLWRQKRLGYDLLFKGMDQLARASDATDTILHVCFERNSPLGSRQKELLHFLETLRKQSKHTFGWTIFNELVVDVTPAGHFDFIEHAHILSGPQHTTARPIVTNVFVPDSAVVDGMGEFGVGVQLPPLDGETWPQASASEAEGESDDGHDE